MNQINKIFKLKIMRYWVIWSIFLLVLVLTQISVDYVSSTLKSGAPIFATVLLLIYGGILATATMIIP